jgi:tetratricopeptide (TPR) repeat protein
MPSILERTLRDGEPSSGSGRAPTVGAPPPPPPQPGSAIEVAQQVIRLRREAKVVRAADPWTVLGIPRDAPSDLVERAGERMTSRYAPLARSANAEVRDLAGQIAGRVRDALEKARERVKAAQRPETATMKSGFTALQREAWTDADHFFGLAREIAPDSPEALAHLGWARFHNPQLPRDERQEEAFAFLGLATQFDPSYAAGWWFLASACHEAGRDDEARTHLARVLALAPQHVEAKALKRKLES